jgi:hypothetical protein
VLIGTLKLTKVGCDWGGLVMTGGGGGIFLFLGLRETESEARARLADDSLSLVLLMVNKIRSGGTWH